MNVRSKQDEDPNQAKPLKKKYLWLGYGDYSNLGGAAPGRLLDAGLARSPDFLDSIMEALGVKKKKRHRSEGDE